MSEDSAVIWGTFSDLKTVKTRSVVQMIIEVPIERGKQVVEVFGFPQPGAEIPVAVARLYDKGDDEESLPPEEPKRPSERWADIPRVKRAGILCSDEAFQKWARVQGKKHGFEWVVDKIGARGFVLTECGVDRRRDLDNSLESRTAFDKMVERYREETRRVTSA